MKKKSVIVVCLQCSSPAHYSKSTKASKPSEKHCFLSFRSDFQKLCLLLKMAPNASDYSMIAVCQCRVLEFSFPMHNLGPTWYITLAVLNSCLIFPTVFLNLIILVAIQKTPSIHSPSFILFAGLVICQLLGAITIEPFSVSFTLARLFEKWNESCVLQKIAIGLSFLFCRIFKGCCYSIGV